jgi:hypothetical protein
MKPRFVTNMLLAFAGAFVAVASQAFGATTAGWIAFGVGIAVLLGLGLSQLDRSRGLVQRALDGLTALLAIWTVVASVVFTGAALSWLTLGEAIGLFLFAAVGLLAHELSQEGVVVNLRARQTESSDLDSAVSEAYPKAA